MNDLEKIQNNWPAGIKRTKQRACVLSVLEHSEKPLSATDICSKIETAGEAVWLSTVYRVLEFFIKKGMVNKINMMNNEMAMYELNHSKHKHYAICMGCNKIIPMNNCPMENFIPKLEDDNFHVLGHNLELYGYCKNCYRRN